MRCWTFGQRPESAIFGHPGKRPGPVIHAQKELRIALVCFGGISLAVYMHGISKEILKLVRRFGRATWNP